MTIFWKRLAFAIAWIVIHVLGGCGSDSEDSATNERDASTAGKGGAGAANAGGRTGWADSATDATSDATTPDAAGGADSSSAGSSGSAGAGAGGAASVCPTIKVTSAIYAANCGAPTTVSSVATQCDGQQKCSYTMDYTVDPGFDPALLCSKDMTVNYDCVDGSGTPLATGTAYAPPEAGLGSVLSLECACPP